MESFRRDLLNDMSDHRSNIKNNRNTLYSCFIFVPNNKKDFQTRCCDFTCLPSPFTQTLHEETSWSYIFWKHVPMKALCRVLAFNYSHRPMKALCRVLAFNYYTPKLFHFAQYLSCALVPLDYCVVILYYAVNVLSPIPLSHSHHYAMPCQWCRHIPSRVPFFAGCLGRPLRCTPGVEAARSCEIEE